MADVRGYQGGEEVRCPLTSRPFIVPDFRAVAAASNPAPAAPTLNPRLQSQRRWSWIRPRSLRKAAIPYGIRVAGRPGFVYSPHAAKTQLVDVTGTAPGVVVKCPYTNKLFRVPGPNPEEIKPATFPAAPTKPPGETVVETPPASPDNPLPAPVEPTPGNPLDSPR